eukprot:7489264-Pyramimonas_sp.AAC.1
MNNSSLSHPEASRKGGLGVSPETTSSPFMTLKLERWQSSHQPPIGVGGLGKLLSNPLLPLRGWGLPLPLAPSPGRGVPRG